MKRMKSVLAVTISLVILITCMPAIPVFAQTYNGTCGDNVTWSLDIKSGELIISGSGDMNDYSKGAPWDSQIESIKSVNIENSVTSIGDGAFSYCNSLTSITIHDSVTSIGDYAFYGCSSLASIIIPDSVVSIGDCAFCRCSSLTIITIPDAVTSIGETAFSHCNSLTSITIPDSVTSIGNSAFYNTAYYNNDANWKNNVLFIGNHLIKAKSNISGSYTIPTGTKTIADGAFCDCNSLTSITIPDSVTNIGDDAFNYCNSLTSITIPNSVASIGDSAFRYCRSLTSITIPNSVTSIGNLAFSNCRSLTEISVSPQNKYYCSEDGVLFDKDKTTLILCPNAKSGIYTIPDAVTSIGDRAFSHCNSLTSITIPNSVTSIGWYAFQYCSSLISITMPNSVTSIGGYAFYVCSNLTSIIIPDSVMSMGHFAFQACGLTSVIILSGVKSIGDGAFANCNNLTSVTIPDSVTSIGRVAFGGCNSLADVYYSGGSEMWSQINFCDSNYELLSANIHFNSQAPALASIQYGADRFTFGQDITGYVGDVIDSLVVYTSANENIASLDITSSNTDVAEIGTIKIGTGNYITTSENEHIATIPLKLKAGGTSTITITSPEGVSASVLIVAYSKELESEETNQYIQEHTSFVNSNKYGNLTTNASFYNSIWKHEEGSRNFTRYAAWDTIGRVGKFAGLDFYGAFETKNPYDVVLVDLFRSYVNSDKSKTAEVFETTTKNILGSPAVFNDVLDVLKTSESWNSELTQDWLEFTGDVQSDWIQGVFFQESTFDLDDYNPELYAVLKEVFSKADKSGFEKAFKNIKNFGTITDYITSGGDVVFRFFDAYQKYLIAESLFQTNEYVLASVETIAKYQMKGDNSELLLDALYPYWDVCDYDSAFSSVCDIMFEDGLLGSTGNVVYNLLGKELLRDFVYAAIHKVTGLSLGALVATYNLTYVCLDYLSGLGDLSETHKLMNAAALLEKEYIELAKGKAETLVAEKTHQAAAEFDTVWGFLQSLEGYCYKTMSAYVSAFKREYTTNYIIETTITQNPFFAVANGIKLSEDLTSCDSAIQAVVYLENEWVNANCHKGIYSSSNLMTVKCPTDVYVYDSENNLVLSIVDNNVTLCADHITAFVDGDEKIFVLPTDQAYDVKITATGNGTMDYAVKSFNEIELLRTIRFDDVKLVNGSNYTADVPSELYVEKEEYNLKTESGTQIEADYDSLGAEEEILVEISGTITCFGNDKYTATVKLLQGTTEIDSVQTANDSYRFENVLPGEYTLEVSKTNYATHTYEITVGNEDIIQDVKIYLLGDVNGDDSVDSDDAIYLLYYTLLPEEYPIKQDGDFNSDGEINSDDAIYLLYHTLLPDSYPL